MKKWKIWLAIGLIFTSGICIGAVGTGLVIRNKFASVVSDGSPAVARLVQTVLTRKLDLTPEQQEAATATITKTQQKLFLLRRQYSPQAKEIIDDGVNELKASLSEEQQAELDQIRLKALRRFDRFRAPETK